MNREPAMQFKLINLLAATTACCVLFGILTHPLPQQIIIVTLAFLTTRELILFARDLNQSH